MSMIFRNDDVNPSTDLESLHEMYEIIARLFPDAHIVSGVTLFGTWNEKGAIHYDLPLKNKDKKFFYNPNRFLYRHSHVIGDIASHGLFHCKHSELSYDAQEMSIVSSCNFLGVNNFIAPFNDFNDNTIKVCQDNKINLLTNMYQWKSLEYNKFNPDHKYWYWHSWRFTPKQLTEKLSAISAVNS